jgi:hypothetical protein
VTNKLILFFIFIFIQVEAGNFEDINKIILNSKLSFEHKNINSINDSFKISTGVITRDENKVEILIQEPLKESYTLYENHIKFCDIDFGECSNIDQKQLIESPIYKLIKYGIKDNKGYYKDLEWTDKDNLKHEFFNIKLINNSIIEISYFDNLQIFNTLKLSITNI